MQQSAALGVRTTRGFMSEYTWTCNRSVHTRISQ